MIARAFPHPLLTPVIAVVWLLLANDLSAGHLVLGLLLGWAIPLFTATYWPGRPRMRNVPMMIEYAAVVLWDIVVSNIQVAKLVLFRRGESLRSRFIAVPLDLRSPEAIAMLAGTITMTPGTLTADLAADGRTLLVHGLDVDDEAAAVAEIKNRYERRLKEIFES